MRIYFILTFLFVYTIPSFAQNTADTIETRRSFWRGSANYINGKKIPPIEVTALLLTNPESKAEFLKARKSFLWGVIIWAIGAGVAIAAIANKDKKSFGPTIFTGAAISTLSLPFLIKSRKHISKSISIYNKEILKRK